MTGVPVAAAPRLRILDAARELFYADGIGATGVDAVSARAGVSKRTLYREFGSKDALVAEYVRRFGVPGALPAEDLLADEGRPGRERLLAAFAALAADVERYGWRGCPATGAALELADPGHPAREAVLAHKRRFRERAAAAAHDAGVPRRAAARVAEQLAVLWDGALVHAVIERSPEPVHAARRLAERVVDDAAPGS
jgi:AcrR family transcriptional regulator